MRLLELQFPVDELRLKKSIFLAVHRVEFRLQANEFRLLDALRRGLRIGEAVAAVSEACPAVERYFGHGWLWAGVATCANGSMALIQTIAKFYDLLIRAANSMQSVVLLAIRLYWGWQFMQTGWGKLHTIDKVTAFFTDLGIPAPGLNAYFIGSLEFLGGILLALGLGSRLIALLLTANMLVAYITADREALFSIFSDPGKFYAAAPYTFLFASVLILVFGPGRYSLDALIAARMRREPHPG